MIDPSDEFEFFFDKPWSDGLPVVPPTEERIRRVREQIEAMPPRRGLTRDGARFRRIRASLPAPVSDDGDA